MGRNVQVSTKSEGNALVHEMCINADALEQRYKVSPDQVLCPSPPQHYSQTVLPSNARSCNRVLSRLCILHAHHYPLHMMFTGIAPPYGALRQVCGTGAQERNAP